MYLLIITGLSGAGKSSVLASLEDAGFYCVDNIPAALIKPLVEICAEKMPKEKRIAVVTDARELILDNSADKILDTLNALPCKYEILYLECSNATIERRFNETRRRHPLCEHVSRGIAMEREILISMREHASYIVDTSSFRPSELKSVLTRIIGKDAATPFSVIIQSFGYKNGVPMETDIVFDMRFLSNPYYNIELRPLSGLDKAVADYINRDPSANDFLDMVEANIRMIIPKFIKQGKHRLMISFGCTGGRHRSVFSAANLAKRLADMSPTLVHRDLSNWTPNSFGS